MTASNQNHTKMLPALETVNMSKRFGSFVALDRVTMKIKPGTVRALLGENGAGKCTLVKCIMGFYQPTEGEVVIDRRSCQINSTRDAHKCRILILEVMAFCDEVSVLRKGKLAGNGLVKDLKYC
ncbi:MAG TPA: ATP-binding cassette domain-containing protein [Coleofasciculaceae cyanobacterium]|jgi:simple sugar transport system ATP-binding protein